MILFSCNSPFYFIIIPWKSLSTCKGTHATVSIAGLLLKELQKYLWIMVWTRFHYAGNRPVKLTSAIHSQDSGDRFKSAKRNQMSNLEAKLDDLRRTISSRNGGIFPHAVLSTEQISLLNCHTPTTIAEVNLGLTCYFQLSRLPVHLQHVHFFSISCS